VLRFGQSPRGQRGERVAAAWLPELGRLALQVVRRARGRPRCTATSRRAWCASVLSRSVGSDSTGCSLRVVSWQRALWLSARRGAGELAAGVLLQRAPWRARLGPSS